MQNSTSRERWMGVPATDRQGDRPRPAPRGLECLTVLDELLVSQKSKVILLQNVAVDYRYKVKNVLGENVYIANEKINITTDDKIKLLDQFNNEVMQITCPDRCSWLCCFPSCRDMVEVSAPPGHVIGTVEEVLSFTKPRFQVKNTVDTVIFNIEGPSCYCFGNVTMHIFNTNDQLIGMINKHWFGPHRTWFSGCNYFSLSFPLHLDVEKKALLLGAVFLINNSYYDWK